MTKRVVVAIDGPAGAGKSNRDRVRGGDVAGAVERRGRLRSDPQPRGVFGRLEGRPPRQEIRERDQRDRTRAEAPLVQAPDATYVDTTPLTTEEVEQVILKLIRERYASGKAPSRWLDSRLQPGSNRGCSCRQGAGF